MFRKSLLSLVILFGLVLVASCQPQPSANMPNPASVFCEENGGKLEIRTDASGGQAGVCVFPDGSECDEWAYMRGECKPGDSLAQVEDDTPGANMPNPASVYCEEHGGKLEIRTGTDGGQIGVCVFPDTSECEEWAYMRGECKPATDTPTANDSFLDWREYRGETLGYRFFYPGDAQIVENDEPDKSFTIQGPQVGDGNAYAISIAHPDREDFHPPEDANLEQWLADHNLVGENRMDDITIGGTTAIHYRHERSPQSYADDRYFFAHGGQLYQIILGHTADVEDWQLYNHFLESWTFNAR